jgi:Flp pilus assembly protein TadG
MTRRRLSRLANDRRGAAVIELALVAPVLTVLVIGIVDISNAFSRKLALEQGVQRAIERIMQTTANTTVENALATEVVCQVNGMNSDGTCKSSPITTSNVTVTFRLECTDSGGTMTTQTSTDATTFDSYNCGSGTVTEARYIEANVTDKYTPMFPITFSGLDSDGTYHISATAGMRTE